MFLEKKLFTNCWKIVFVVLEFFLETLRPATLKDFVCHWRISFFTKKSFPFSLMFNV